MPNHGTIEAGQLSHPCVPPAFIFSSFQWFRVCVHSTGYMDGWGTRGPFLSLVCLSVRARLGMYQELRRVCLAWLGEDRWDALALLFDVFIRPTPANDTRTI